MVRIIAASMALPLRSLGKQALQNVRNFEYGTDLLLFHGGAKPSVIGWFQHLFHCLGDLAEAVDHQAYALLPHPFRVVALLRHGPTVVLYNHGQLHHHGFTEGAWARLANEEVR